MTMAAPRKYSLELRERAVRMYRTADPKPQIKRLAAGLGVRPGALRGWIRQAEADAGERDDRLTTGERAGLGALRKENAQLKRANEVLRTASAFFAAPDPPQVTALIDEHPHLGAECVLPELHIASSTYYRWRRAGRQPCERRRRDDGVPLVGAADLGQGVRPGAHARVGSAPCS